jgi:hypothetical protein
MALDPIRKFPGHCSRMQVFQIFYSFGVGTGTGFESLLSSLCCLMMTRIATSSSRSPGFRKCPRRPYNYILAKHALIGQSDCVFRVEDEAPRAVQTRRFHRVAEELSAPLDDSLSDLPRTPSVAEISKRVFEPANMKECATRGTSAPFNESRAILQTASSNSFGRPKVTE